MNLFDLTDGLHKKSGFTGDRLNAVTFATALRLADYAGPEHQAHFRQRFREALEKLDNDGVSDVVGFVAEQAGIRPAPYHENEF